MLKQTLLGAAALGFIMVNAAFAGVAVKNLGKPQCIDPNPPANYTRAQVSATNVRGNYYDDGGVLYGSDPYTPWETFIGSPYSLIAGAPGAERAATRFDYPTPQTEVDMVWGTIDPGNVVELKAGDGTVVGRISGRDLTARLGVAINSDVYISLTNSVPWRKLELKTNNVSFEFNVAGCSE